MTTPFLDGIKKLARFDIIDVEKDIGVYLPDEVEDMVRNEVQKQIESRFAVRHPILAGIPTLGIAPSISKGRALEEIRHKLLRSYPSLAEMARQTAQQEFERELAKQQVEQPERFAHALATAYVGGKLLDRL